MSIISNKEKLLEKNTGLRQPALEILEAGLGAIDTKKILKRKLKIENNNFSVGSQSFDLDSFKRIFFVGIGKCAFDGAEYIEEILGDRLTQGVVVDVKGGVLKKIRSFVGTHPYPSQLNVSVTSQIVSMLTGLTQTDLVLVLVSGGGSSLLCMPHDMNCETLVNITKALTEKGADIFELNTVRKHFSEIQGGGLAKICYPAKIVSLIFSDVLGNDVGMVASGPTVYDGTTVADAAKILMKYDVLRTCVPPKCDFLETPKDPKYFVGVKNFLICSNDDALLAMKNKAEELGFRTRIESNQLSGNARAVAKIFVEHKLQPKTCLLFGGETTVKVAKSKTDGVKSEGGRNQEVVLAALDSLPKDTLLIAAASDGWDNTVFAGALGDDFVLAKAKSLGINPREYLESSNSYNFFKTIEDGALCTGRLGSNVSDLYIIISK